MKKFCNFLCFSYSGVFRLNTVQRCFFVSIVSPVFALGGLIIAACRRRVNFEIFSFIGFSKIVARKFSLILLKAEERKNY